MSFKGSLQTVPLPEVLTFLSETEKTGDLRVRGTHVEGHLVFDGGAISGVHVGRSHDAVDAIFQLLRNDEGDFDFDSVEQPFGELVSVEPAADVPGALASARERLAEWVDIVAVVPSLSHRLALAPNAPDDQVVLDAGQWAMVVAVGEGRTVGDVLDARGLGEFEGCRALRTLVGSELVQLSEPASGPVISYCPAESAELADPLPFEEPATPGSSEDHYAALRAMIVDVDHDLSDTGSAFDPLETAAGEQPVYEEDADPMDAEAALQAVLAEVSSAGEPEVAATSVDGLADRGPWPEHELAAMDGWGEGADVEAPGDAVAASAEHEALEEAAADEPMNRGLLLKFLSSVRN